MDYAGVLFSGFTVLTFDHLLFYCHYSHSVHDVAASLREQLLESNTEKEELRMMYSNLQQSQSSLQYEIEMLKQENHKLMEERKSQVNYVCDHVI